MTALKILLAVATGVLAALVLIMTTALVATMLAVSNGGSVTVPGMISAIAGSGADIATVQLAPAAPLWFLGIAVVVAVVGLTLPDHRDRRRERETTAGSTDSAG